MLEIIALIVVALAAVVAALLALGWWRLRRFRHQHLARIEAVGASLVTQAAFFGQASAAKFQARAPGTLALGPDDLVFVSLVPGQEVRVPREAITSTSAARHFLGKTTGRDLLIVTWDVNGLGDAVAFDLPDITAWRDALE